MMSVKCRHYFYVEKFRNLPKKHKIIPKKQYFVLRTVYMLVFRCAVTWIYRFEKCHMLLSINEGKRDFLKAKSKKSGKEVRK